MTKPTATQPLAPRTRDATAPTLLDVARQAGVSTATVSRCLNAPERVVASTRERVLAAVRDLGYAPNFGARLLAARCSSTIGAIIPTMENAIFARGLQAFQEELTRHGLTLLVASSSYSPELEAEQVRNLTARGADGLLLIGHDRLPETYDFLERRALPYVIAWAHEPEAGRPSVGFDNRAAMRRLTEAALAEGHRRLAMISAPTAANDRARRRLEGVRAAMAECGLDPAALVLVETPYGIENGAAAFRSVMRRAERPSVVMCGNDVLAVGALDMARRMGLRVPEDVSITGFDDIEIAQITTPRLTTVHVPHREMGRRAALALVGLIDGTRPAESVALDVEIRRRESLGPPPAG